MKKTQYGIRAMWWGLAERPDELGARFLETLDKLEPLSPAMNNWLLVDFVDLVLRPLTEVRSGIADLVLKNVGRDDDDEVDPREGYWMSAEGAESKKGFKTPRSVEVSIRSGSQWLNDAEICVGGIGRPADPALATYPIYRGALEILASTWPCPWVEAHAFRPNFPPLKPATIPLTAARELDPPRETYYFPWMLYLSAPLAAGLEPPKDLLREATPGGGMILSAVQDRLDPDNPDHTRRARLLQTIIDQRLPPDPVARLGMATPPARIGPY